MVIILTRKHLNNRFEHHPIQEIEMQMFNSHFLSVNTMQHADNIIFVETAVNPERFDVKELKNRFGRTETHRNIQPYQLATILSDKAETMIN